MSPMSPLKQFADHHVCRVSCGSAVIFAAMSAIHANSTSWTATCLFHVSKSIRLVTACSTRRRNSAAGRASSSTVAASEPNSRRNPAALLSLALIFWGGNWNA